MTPDTAVAQTPLIRVGFDLARVSAVAESLRQFGRRFADRLFTANEQAYALCGNALFAERLAARFAAKEAVIKALNLSEAGVNWRDIEICKRDSGECAVVLHGRARQMAQAMGVRAIALSMSHDGDVAGAFVNVVADREPPRALLEPTQ